LLTYISIQSKRGKEGMEAAGVLPYFRGIAARDCLSANRFARFDRRKGIAGVLKPVRAGSVENRAAHAAAHLERCVRGVDNRVNAKFCDVVSDNCK
jgi:hypothetical protein